MYKQYIYIFIVKLFHLIYVYTNFMKINCMICMHLFTKQNLQQRHQGKRSSSYNTYGRAKHVFMRSDRHSNIDICLQVKHYNHIVILMFTIPNLSSPKNLMCHLGLLAIILSPAKEPFTSCLYAIFQVFKK
jgi:hypothetical protein